MSDKKLRELIMHFNKVPLRQQDFDCDKRKQKLAKRSVGLRFGGTS